ncbi:tRNA dimethylallyltransferase [Sporotomaculum syntrophicum]|uniref:tRNA dimethylallyltransferase n=1 Tax=Sporotomaculum syntrophicum TaxID=182264 RepID=A0A9D3AXN0_9FIRM|nr:tRNA (adenosine(37)-N6)-dimethylallyltransferase MiaA [Sporotomaculum syntrophicum]KAF1084641.1 tRNA dimethylallyltransferase [Sporotomaculum syntrophicum]
MKHNAKIPLMVIAGPTATGKTEIAVEVAQNLNGEVVSADSMLIYRYMNIGTAKPTMQEMKGIPHHLIDIIDPSEDFSVACYQQLAREAIENIYLSGKIPLLVGGTGFYIDAVLYNYDFSGATVDRELRKSLHQMAEDKGNEAVYKLLQIYDRETAARIHVNDLKRIIRALEIYKHTGTTGALFRNANKQIYRDYEVIFVVLYYDRKTLYQRIEARVDKMIKQGLVTEVRGLLDAGYQRNLVAMQGLGYKEIVGFLLNEYSLDEAVQLLKRNTRRLAKRQLTWFRRYSSIKWIDMEKYDTINKVTEVIKNLWLNAQCQ